MQGQNRYTKYVKYEYKQKPGNNINSVALANETNLEKQSSTTQLLYKKLKKKKAKGLKKRK